MPAKIEALLTNMLKVDPSSPIFYTSESGTRPDWRNRGLASIAIGSIVRAQPNLPIVLRTNFNGPSLYGIATKLGFAQVYGKIRGSNEQVVNFLDEINPERVLFVKYLKSLV